MRTFKLIGALALVLAFSAIGVASASAAETLWPWLPGSAKETFTGKSGVATLVTDGGGEISCTKSLTLLSFGGVSSELLENNAKLALALIHFEGCKAEKKFAVNSDGDLKEIILVHVELHNCMIKKGDFGVLFLLLPVHLEIPAALSLVAVEGSFVALIAPLTGEAGKPKHYELNIKQTGGLQEIKECEGALGPDTLLSKTNNGTFKEAGEEAAEGLLLFDGTIDKTGEEMMEK